VYDKIGFLLLGWVITKKCYANVLNL